TGPWVDEVRQLDYATNGKHLKLSKGVHIVFDKSVFPLQQAVYFDSPDKRMIFAIPRHGKTYVGTSDDFYEGDPKEMDVSKEEVTYLLNAIDYMFPHIQVSENSVESSWAGVRPLIHEEGKAPSEISRKDEIWEAESGLITMAGGKLTGYRKMAETTVDLLYEKYIESSKFTNQACQTKQLHNSGGDAGGSKNWHSFKEKSVKTLVELGGINREKAEALTTLNGSNIDQIIEYIETNDSGLPDDLYAELMYAVHHEMALTPTDFFIRRTSKLLFEIENVKNQKEMVISFMAKQFDWTD